MTSAEVFAGGDAELGEDVAQVPFDRALAYGFPGGQELAAGAFGETFHPHRGQHPVPGATLPAGVETGVFTPEAFAVDQARAGQLRVGDPIQLTAIRP